ncbi:replication initiation protein [Sebaldella sp. S0638]|uniref:replication initiation protein n=1 Tax=Sebaldella sp. S0638 TaxID=2957809 RepID=UPI00209E3F01|nr:replication initiation protein [Sebaldella sp. S0638]MCP1224729.1 replication initiation protein [Sebaldella sp. S0638]
MLNIYNSQQFNFLKKHNFSVLTNKALNKKEKKFLKILYLSCGILDKNNSEISYKIEEILNVLNYDSITRLEKFLNNIISKRVFYRVEEDNKLLQNGSFGIINSYSVYKGRIYFLLSEEILLSFIEKTLFSYLKIDKFIFMEENFSYNLYLYLIPLFYNQKEVVIDLDKLKNILNAETSYERFYDFEKYILKKAIEDIVTFSKYNLSYYKMKTGKNVNNKVTAIKFILNNEKPGNYFDVKHAANELLNVVKTKVVNINEMYELILLYIIKRSYDYVLTNIKYTLANYTDNIEKHLKKALLYDLGNTEKIDKYALYVEDIAYFKTPFILQMNLWRHLNKVSAEIPDYDDVNRLYYSDFFKKIIKLRDKEEFDFSNDTVRIYIKYNEKEDSIIRIYIHKEG